MTDTMEAPTLTPGPELTRMLAALAYTAGQALQRRRARQAARDQERSVTAALRPGGADPPVRTLLADEAAGFDRSQAEHQRSTDSEVSVAVGPLGDGGWGLIAQAATDGGELVAAVRCSDELVARSVAEEVLARGRGGVSRLHQVGELALARAVAAGRGEVESDEQLWSRTARAVHEAWPGHARLVEQVVHGPSGSAGMDPRFAALAARLEQLEGRGYPMVEVLRAVNPERVARELGRLGGAAAVDDQISRSLTGIAVVNLGGPLRPAWQGTPKAAEKPPADDPAITALLTATLPEKTVAKIRAGNKYGALVDDLRARVARGENVGELLSRFRGKATFIEKAFDPAAYLMTALAREAKRVVVDGAVVVAPAAARHTSTSPRAEQRPDQGRAGDAAAHTATAAASETRARSHEHDAAASRTMPDEQTTAHREDLHTAGDAQSSDALGSRERAVAAGEHAAAAAARALLTPDGGPARPTRGPAGGGRSAPRRPGAPRPAVSPRAEQRMHR